MVDISGLDGGVPFETASPWRKKRKGVPDATRIERFVASYEAFVAEMSPARRILDRAEEEHLVRYTAMFARIEGAARQGGLRALLRIERARTSKRPWPPPRRPRWSTTCARSPSAWGARKVSAINLGKPDKAGT